MDRAIRSFESFTRTFMYILPARYYQPSFYFTVFQRFRRDGVLMFIHAKLSSRTNGLKSRMTPVKYQVLRGGLLQSSLIGREVMVACEYDRLIYQSLK